MHDLLVRFHVVDVRAHFNAVPLVSGEKSSVAIESFRKTRLLPFATPNEITLDSERGEFFPYLYAEELTLLGTKPDYRPNGVACLPC